jgi:hypothetical protein
VIPVSLNAQEKWHTEEKESQLRKYPIVSRYEKLLRHALVIQGFQWFHFCRF